MALILTVLEIVAPVFILAAIGFTWVKFDFEYRIEFVTRLTMTISVPCLIFSALMGAEIGRDTLAVLLGASALCYLTLFAVFGAVLWVRGLDLRTFCVPLVFGNTGNLGLPLALFAFGPEGLSYAIVVFAVMAIMSFTLGIWVVAGGGNPIATLKEPIVAATILGTLFLWNGWETPEFLSNTTELIGQMAIPLMLISLGVALARLKLQSALRAGWLSVVKICASIAIAAAIGLWLGLNETAFAVLVLQISTPVAVTSYFLAAKYGADADEVASLVVVSTLISVIALPITLAFLI